MRSRGRQFFRHPQWGTDVEPVQAVDHPATHGTRRQGQHDESDDSLFGSPAAAAGVGFTGQHQGCCGDHHRQHEQAGSGNGKQ
jgi:hypothetical protein